MINKLCSSCLKSKIETDFWTGKNRCIECLKRQAKEYRSNNPIAEKSRKLLYYYGIDIEKYYEKLAAQNGKCNICAKHYTEVGTLAVDHDHNCLNMHDDRRACEKCLRDLLCQDCNRAIGLFEENIEFLENAVKYIKKHKKGK